MTPSAQRQALLDGERHGAAWSLVPPRTPQSVAGGPRHGRRAGGSLEFRDYRDYQPGDDLRHLDWNVFARSDKLTVKQFHEEVSPLVELIVDGSRSMALGESRKGEVALSLAAMLATAARNAGFPYVFSMAREQLVKIAQGQSKPSLWTDIDFAYPGDPAPALLRAAPLLRPLSVRIVVSDLLWAVDPVPVLHALGSGASSLILIEVLAAADERPDLAGDWRLVDSESEETDDIVFDAAAAVQYRNALLRHRELWDVAAREAHATIVRCVADDLGDGLMFDELAAAEILRPA